MHPPLSIRALLPTSMLGAMAYLCMRAAGRSQNPVLLRSIQLLTFLFAVHWLVLSVGWAEWIGVLHSLEMAFAGTLALVFQPELRQYAFDFARRSRCAQQAPICWTLSRMLA